MNTDDNYCGRLCQFLPSDKKNSFVWFEANYIQYFSSICTYSSGSIGSG